MMSELQGYWDALSRSPVESKGLLTILLEVLMHPARMSAPSMHLQHLAGLQALIGWHVKVKLPCPNLDNLEGPFQVQNFPRVGQGFPKTAPQPFDPILLSPLPLLFTGVHPKS